ncbi:MAG: serine hydrolase domain-containing protein [Bacteroidota bacterium]
MLKPSRLCLLVLCLALFTIDAGAQGLPEAAPEDVGISSDRLARVDQLMEKHVDASQIAGAISLVARNGKVVHFNAYGARNIATGEPMTTDTIVRIYSMSKPITSVALMMLYEEGAFHLDDPVEKYIPAFKNQQVYVEGPAANPVLRPVENKMTIRHLLTHSSGLSYGIFSNTVVDSLYRKETGRAWWPNLEKLATSMGSLPLLFEPGDRWYYSLATDVLGYLVEVLSGQPFDEFLHARIFDPLNMVDTGFFVPADKINRFAANHGIDNTGKLMVVDPPNGQFSQKPAFLSGGGGLVSTASDYVRFAQMLLNGGELDGVRILGRKTVEYMTVTHIDGVHAPGYGFGLGFSVRLEDKAPGVIGTPGTYGWNGAANTHYFADPEEQVIGIFMTQLMPYGRYPLLPNFRVALYQSLVD